MKADQHQPSMVPGSHAGFATRTLVGLVKVYRVAVSPMFAPACRYWPSCSEFTIEALQHHGAWRGGLLSAGRLLRCTPWHAGGVDPVPLSKPSFAWQSLPPFRSRWRAYREAPSQDQPTTESSSSR